MVARESGQEVHRMRKTANFMMMMVGVLIRSGALQDSAYFTLSNCTHTEMAETPRFPSVLTKRTTEN